MDEQGWSCSKRVGTMFRQGLMDPGSRPLRRCLADHDLGQVSDVPLILVLEERRKARVLTAMVMVTGDSVKGPVSVAASRDDH